MKDIAKIPNFHRALLVTLPTALVWIMSTNLVPVSADLPVSLAFDGDSSYKVFEDLSFIISTEKGANKITIYPMSNSGLTIFSSNLADGSGGTIPSGSVTFDQNATFKTSNMTPGVPIPVDISVIVSERGVYHGRLFVRGEGMTSVPFVVDTGADWIAIMFWVFLGIVLPIIVWNFVGFLYVYKGFNDILAKVKERIERLFKAQDATVENLRNRNNGQEYSRAASMLARVIQTLKVSDVKTAKKELTLFEQSFPELSIPTSNLAANPIDTNRLFPAGNNDYDSLLGKFQQGAAQVKFSVKNNISPDLVRKKITIGISTISLGIVVGLIPLLQSVYVTNLRVIGNFDVLILLGLGLGIGNLGDAILKIWGDKDT